MAFSVKIIAALATVIFRDVLRRLNYSQAVPLQGSLSGAEVYGYLGFLVSVILYYLKRNMLSHCLIGTIRESSRPELTIPSPDSMDSNSLSSDNRVAHRVEKVKSWVNSCNFQGSRTLQQQALRYITKKPSEFSQTVNTKWTTSKFIPKCSSKPENGSYVRRSPQEDVCQSPNRRCDEFCRSKQKQKSQWVGGSAPELIGTEMSDMAVPGPSWSNPDKVRGKDHLACPTSQLQDSLKKTGKALHFQEDVCQSPNRCSDEFCRCERKQNSLWIGGSSRQISVPSNVEPEPIITEMSDMAAPGPSWANPDKVRGKDHLACPTSQLQDSLKRMGKALHFQEDVCQSPNRCSDEFCRCERKQNSLWIGGSSRQISVPSNVEPESIRTEMSGMAAPGPSWANPDKVRGKDHLACPTSQLQDSLKRMGKALHFQEDVCQSPNRCSDEFCTCERKQTSLWTGGSSSQISVPSNVEPESISTEMSDMAAPGPSWANPDMVRGKDDEYSKLSHKVYHKKIGDHLASPSCKLQYLPKKVKVCIMAASRSHAIDKKNHNKCEDGIRKMRSGRQYDTRRVIRKRRRRPAALL